MNESGPTPWNPIADLGAAVRAQWESLAGGIRYTGGLTRLARDTLTRAAMALVLPSARIRLRLLLDQMVRVGVKSIPIVILVQIFIGIILALNLAPTLDTYGQLERTADVVAIAIFRELGPLITAILLSGFAGASIAAEIGAMVEGEEIKAMRAHALDPVRFLVVPRIFATTLMMLGLTVLADVVGVFGGFLTATFVLKVPAQTYIDATQAALSLRDYFTGLFKGTMFGAIIAVLACHEGLRVAGGAEGVGQATTTTVVKSIVCLIAADMVMTTIFYVVGW